MNIPNLKKFALVCLALLAMVATAESVFNIVNEINAPRKIEVENAILKAERDSARAEAATALRIAKIWAQEANKSKEIQPIIRNYYHEKAALVHSRPFPIRSGVFSETLDRLDTLGK